MDHLPPPEMSLTRANGSVSELAPSPEVLNFASQRATLMFGCYRKGDANDPETYTAAVTLVLAEYEPEVIRRVTDPRTGIPRRMKFMPNPAEVAEACDDAKRFIEAEKSLESRGYYWDETQKKYIKDPDEK